MKKLAARDWEDMLQVALPIFEGLLDEPYNTVVLDLLFTLATWHALAKLRMHTDGTLSIFEATTANLGTLLRRFAAKVCNRFVTRELPSEEAARGRRTAAKATQNKQKGRRQGKKAQDGGNAGTSTGSTEGQSPSVSHLKKFSLTTYKTHALGDYPAMIRMFGTTDSYSTQTGELEHRRVKRFYGRTNKQNFTRQITKQHMREELIRRVKKRVEKKEQEAAVAKKGTPEPDTSQSDKELVSPESRGIPASLSFEDSDPLPYTPPENHHHISQSNRFHKDVTDWLSSNKNDPALKNFVPHLKDHLLARLAGDEYDGDEREYTDAERRALIFVDNRIYQHKVIRINYTTYDLRRAQDSLNPRTHADVMVASQEDQGARNSHPYWYARIVGIFHAYVQHVGSSSKSEEPRRLDFLWVRWFGRDLTTPGGFRTRRLHRIGFVDIDELAFGFLDPDLICRGVHIIPAFAHGKTSELLGPSIVRSVSDNDEDWVFYYVNIFADRDMFMRYLGGGVGHRVVQSMLDSVASVVTAEEEQGEQVAEARESEVQRLNVPEDEQVLTEGVSDDEEEATDEIGDEVPPDDAEYDYGYDGAGPNDEDGGDEDGEELGEEELGPEDGEDDVGEDDNFEGMEGFAPL
ncbi:hypothetical protein PHLCEN_2v2303 [Hermanssonia centrifuga]|uniref:Uncharacterized protein n=1 Tax=Hermanssonia centrifuga TaxID=98765 RepID=A0A2R6RPG8_9APHY|nr:hypothetical protein PHLCEN_2v2303 [Hermanssonia centrifuga]